MTKRSDVQGPEVLAAVEASTAPGSLQDITRACGLPTSGTRYANDNECHVHGILTDLVGVGVVLRDVGYADKWFYRNGKGY